MPLWPGDELDPGWTHQISSHTKLRIVLGRIAVTVTSRSQGEDSIKPKPNTASKPKSSNIKGASQWIVNSTRVATQRVHMVMTTPPQGRPRG